MALLVGADLSTVDVDKLGKLLDLQKDWENRQAEKAFNSALANFQAEMPAVFKRRRETQGKYTYASYDDIMYLARPFLRKNGLAISCSQTDTESTLTIEMTISHKDGHSRKTTYSTPKDGPIKTREGRNVTSEAQAQNSSNTYARRLCLCNALDIVVTDEDDNGQAAADDPVSADQATEIYNLLEQCPKGTKEGFLNFLEAESVEKIPSAKFGKAIAALKKKIKDSSK